MSRIYYRGKFFDYPLKAFNALRNLGLVEAMRCVLVVRLGPRPPAEGPDHVRGLDRGPLRLAALPHFFKTYNEKVWGVPAIEIPADWAAQRIKNLSLVQRARCNCPAPEAQPEGHHVASSRSSSTRSSAPG